MNPDEEIKRTVSIIKQQSENFLGQIKTLNDAVPYPAG
jgi:hypothetical protein